jgi:hypothetical protein
VLVIISAVFAGVVYFAYDVVREFGGDVARESDGATRTGEAANTVSLDTLLADYDANEVAADQKYKGQRIRTSGVLKEVKKDLLDHPFVLVSTSDNPFTIRQLQCSLSESAVQEAAQLARGATVTVQGSVRGLLLNVQLTACTFVAQGAPLDASGKTPAKGSGVDPPTAVYPPTMPQAFTMDRVISFEDGTANDRALLKSVAKEMVADDFSIAREDLNDDGVKEIIIIGGRDFCGSGGCGTEVFEKQGDNYVRIFDQGLTPILVVTKERVGKFRALAMADDKGNILIGDKEGTPMYGKQMVYPVGVATGVTIAPRTSPSP